MTGANIQERLAAVGIHLRSSAPGNYKITCPRCSAHRKPQNRRDPCLSVTVSPMGDGAVWQCHNCQWETPKATDGSADSEAFWGPAREGRRSTEPQRRPQPKPQPKPVKNDLEPLKGGARRWLESRGLTSAVIDRMQVSSAMHVMPQVAKYGRTPVPTVAFPYLEGGKIVDVKYRTSDKEFAHSQGAKKILYNLDSLEGKTVGVILEGEMDVLSALVAGVDKWAGVVSLPDGAPEVIREDEQDQMDVAPDPETDGARYQPLWHALNKYPNVERWILAGDDDKAGLVLRQQIARRLGKVKCSTVKWPNINDAPLKDCNEVLMQEGPEVVRECIENARPYPISGLYRMSDFSDEVEQTYLVGRPRCTSTGWKNLDKVFKLPDGALMVVTGVPGSGKSEWVDSLCMNLALNEGWVIGFCSMENMPGEDHIPKLLQKYFGKPFFQKDLVSPRITRDELTVGRDWGQKHFVFMKPDDSDAVTIEWIIERAQRAVNMFGIRILVIDPYNEIVRDGKEGEVEYLSRMLGLVKRFCQRNRVTVIFVAHPTKMQRDRNGVIQKPSLYDIAGGAHWFNKMDVGIVIDREWDEFESLDGQKHAYRSKRASIDVRKVRFNWIGSPGTVTLKYDAERSRYTDGDEDDEE